jgi:CUE domain
MNYAEDDSSSTERTGVFVAYDAMVVDTYMQDLISEWDVILKNDHPSRNLVTPLQFYQLGCVLEEQWMVTIKSKANKIHQQLLNALYESYDAYLQSIPSAYCTQLFTDLVESIIRLIQLFKEDRTTIEEIATAFRALVQLYDHSSMASKTCYTDWCCSNENERLSLLLECYSFQLVNPNVQSAILSILSHCVLHMFSATKLSVDTNWENVIPFIHWMQQSPVNASNDSTIWDDFVLYMNRHDPSWKERLLQQLKISESHQNEDYVQSLLSNDLSSTVDDRMAIHQAVYSSQSCVVAPAKPRALYVKSPEQELQDRIDQVRTIAPHFGEGFIEVALSCYKGNVEQAIAVLLDEDESRWPMPLKIAERSLPRRHAKSSITTLQKEEAEAKAITKATIQLAEKQAELEARMLELVLTNVGDSTDVTPPNRPANVRQSYHDEYDDDYDDQYDDIDGFMVGNVDAKLYDDDYNAILTYNRAMKEVEVEQEFWNENRNTNAKIRGTTGTTEGSEGKAYRGPDLIRGGRIPGGRISTGGGRELPSDDKEDKNSTISSGDKKDGTKKPNLRHKGRVLDKRRDQQKKAQMKRTGA